MKKIIALFASLLLAANIAQAAPISGEMSITGDYVPTGGTGLGDATGIDFLGDDFEVTGVTLDLASSVSVGDTGSITDFSFAPFAAVTPLWSIGGFSFDLNNVNIDFQSSAALLLSGNGMLKHASFDDTAGRFTLTANAGVTTFSFSSSTVPEPGVLALLGLGLLGLGAARMKARRS